jgi:hypothetical protein
MNKGVLAAAIVAALAAVGGYWVGQKSVPLQAKIGRAHV